MKNDSALKARIHNLCDIDLVKMIKEASKYEPEAISFAREELSHRGGLYQISARLKSRISQQEPKQKGLFSKIESREDALMVVKHSSTVFFLLAAFQAAFSPLVGFSILIGAIIYAVSAFFLRRFNSRSAAVVLLVLSVLGTGVKVANKAVFNLGGENNTLLAFLVLFVAVRGYEATFKLHGRFSAEAQANKTPPT